MELCPWRLATPAVYLLSLCLAAEERVPVLVHQTAELHGECTQMMRLH